MENLVEIIQIVATAVIAVLSMFAPKVYKKFLAAVDVADLHAGKIDLVAEKVRVAVDEATDPIQIFKKKIADGNLSAEDIQEIVTEVNEAKGAIKDIKYEKVSG